MPAPVARSYFVNRHVDSWTEEDDEARAESLASRSGRRKFVRDQAETVRYLPGAESLGQGDLTIVQLIGL